MNNCTTGSLIWQMRWFKGLKSITVPPLPRYQFLIYGLNSHIRYKIQHILQSSCVFPPILQYCGDIRFDFLCLFYFFLRAARGLYQLRRFRGPIYISVLRSRGRRLISVLFAMQSVGMPTSIVLKNKYFFFKVYTWK